GVSPTCCSTGSRSATTGPTSTSRRSPVAPRCAGARPSPPAGPAAGSTSGSWAPSSGAASTAWPPTTPLRRQPLPDQAPQPVDVDVLGRADPHHLARLQVQPGGQLLLALVADRGLHLVVLGGDHDVGALVVAQPLDHLDVERGGPDLPVDQDEDGD